ncbi:hypothetical protein H181DRAFT_05642 [Streptomyces sp. WMMB 714]|nr:hypothetical protein H181DRAFT_05642 [Streptomyces sp. WMMB 714]
MTDSLTAGGTDGCRTRDGRPYPRAARPAGADGVPCDGTSHRRG